MAATARSSPPRAICSISLEPEVVAPAWKRWTPALLRPPGTLRHKAGVRRQQGRQTEGHPGGLRTARRVWLATDCDREGQLIGQEILEHYGYRGTVMRVMFTAQDAQTFRDAFAQAKPNTDYARLYAAAVARRQADQIYNLSLTRTATVTLAARRPHRAWESGGSRPRPLPSSASGS